ncbi:MAG: hypothetical protein QHJ34_07165 [bacterium]|jgi:hypothetical protein|nr:hypothetical protein [candidate division KSB1 bacterium]MDH7559999.1 hypothetical protein [bacterium]
MTAYKGGQECEQLTSDGSGYYDMCLDRCRKPQTDPVWIDVVAAYDDMYDFYSFLCYGQDEWHDFSLYYQ